MIVQLNLVVSLHLLYFRKMLLRQGLDLDSIPLMDLRCYFIPDILVQMLDLFKDSPLKFGTCASTLRQLVITVMFLAPISPRFGPELLNNSQFFFENLLKVVDFSL